MPDDYKSSPNWQALNRIWKVLPPAARETVQDDFRMLTDLVKERRDPAEGATPAAKPGFDYENRYLDGMSRQTKRFALKRLTLKHTDVYQEIADLIAEQKIADMDALWDAYTAAHGAPGEDEPALREIMCVCLERARALSPVSPHSA